MGTPTVRGTIESVIAGYVLGTLPSSDLAARAASRGATSVRDAGTGNPGALNTSQVLGRRWGAAVLAADIGKAWAAAAIGRRRAGARGANLAATASVIGHCFPATRRFAGGKGVACSAGQVLGTMPTYLPLDLAVAGTVAKVSGRTDVATLAGAVTWITTGVVYWRRQWNPGGVTPTAALPLAAAASSAVIAYRFVTAGRPAPEHRYGHDSTVQGGDAR